ncbi:hypothetical protein CLV47_10430 [Antricoccus suffuscus]|uniref:Uncharacterized protein n=1 Tax=Antricoccus suffuscus TaxID=1629062 RepID=A0A2T1A268_9ACTN|nr:hypothetical protein CLV47_10430 [Antricoccus suffuscus]
MRSCAWQRSHYDDTAGGKRGVVVVAQMAQLAGNSMSYDGAADGFRYDKTAPGRLRPTDAFLYVHHEPAARDATTTANSSPEVGAAMYPLPVVEHRAVRPLGALCRDAAATLATPRGKNRATGAGAHAKTETVRLSATTVIGLERPLAHWRALLELRAYLTACQSPSVAGDQMVNDKSQIVGTRADSAQERRSAPLVVRRAHDAWTDRA